MGSVPSGAAAKEGAEAGEEASPTSPTSNSNRKRKASASPDPTEEAPTTQSDGEGGLGADQLDLRTEGFNYDGVGVEAVPTLGEVVDESGPAYDVGYPSTGRWFDMLLPCCLSCSTLFRYFGSYSQVRHRRRATTTLSRL